MPRIRDGTNVTSHTCHLGGTDTKLPANRRLVELINQIAPARKQGPPPPTRLLGTILLALHFRGRLFGPEPCSECGFSSQCPLLSGGAYACLHLCSGLRETPGAGSHLSVQNPCSVLTHSSSQPLTFTLAPGLEHGLGNSCCLSLNSIDSSGSFCACWS